jgi:diaminohydroxyphosphoribosylaminopyrimidine deaminase/5-amino-6-(5-phosphoribosylamino)uracil reductase
MAHAEIVALQAARQAGADTTGGTAWVTLEPCSHHGRTPPCCDALIQAGLRRVVVATIDPNPLVSGAGLQRMRNAGIEVEVAGDSVAQQARELNIGFFSRMRRGLPWVRVKVAASLDGRTALPDGRSQWISGEAARHDGHAWRRRAGAVLTGVGTVFADDPRLDVRHVPTEVQPLRVVFDSHLRAPARSRIFESPGACLVYCARAASDAAHALRSRGVEVIQCAGENDQVDLTAALRDLASRGVNELHVEAGAQLNAGLLAVDRVDEWLLYLAPKLVGPGLGIVSTPVLADLAAARTLRFESIDRCGDDLRVRARPLGRADDLA